VSLFLIGSTERHKQNDPEVERPEKVVNDAFEEFRMCWDYTKPSKKEKDYP
jgi:hypothetical protein